MHELTNAVRDVTFINDEIHEATSGLVDDLNIVKDLFIELKTGNHSVIDDFLTYMDYDDPDYAEDIFEVGIYKYFEENAEEFKQHQSDSLILNRKLIYPKFKLDHFVKSINKYNVNYQ